MSEEISFSANEVITFDSAVKDGLIFSTSEAYEGGCLRYQCFFTSTARALCQQTDVVDKAESAALWDIGLMLGRGATATDVADGRDVYLSEHGLQFGDALHVTAVLDDLDAPVKLFVGTENEIGLVTGLAHSFL